MCVDAHTGWTAGVFEEFGIRQQGALQGYGNLVLDARKTALALLQAAWCNGARLT